MPNPPKKIIPNANSCASFNEIKHRQNYCRIRTGAFTYAMVHLVSRATNRFWVPQTTIETSIIQPFLSFASRLGCLEHTVWDAYEAHNNRNLHFFLFTSNSVEVLSRSPRKEFCFRQNFPQGKLHCSSSTSNFDFNSHLSSQIPLYGLSVSPVLPKHFPCMPK